MGMCDSTLHVQLEYRVLLCCVIGYVFSEEDQCNLVETLAIAYNFCCFYIIAVFKRNPVFNQFTNSLRAYPVIESEEIVHVEKMEKQ